MEGVYLIRDNQTGLHKIGMTTNWATRQRALKVGSVTTKVKFVQCKDSGKWEKVLHAMFRHKRIPQSEWFRITEEDAIPKMDWLASKTNQPMVVGSWQKARAGNYYRWRRSSSGNWYTEQKSAASLRAEHQQRVDSIIRHEATRLEADARKEAGYWPTKDDKSKIEWQESDPTSSQFNPWTLAAFVLGFVLLLNTCSSITGENSYSPSEEPVSKSQSKTGAVRKSNALQPSNMATNMPSVVQERPENSFAADELDEGIDDVAEPKNLIDSAKGAGVEPDGIEEKPQEMVLLPIPLNGSLENICKNSESRLMRLLMREGVEVQPALQGSIFVVGLESQNSEEPPSLSAIDLMRNQYNLQQYARDILDNCDQYSGVRFGFWSIDKWTTFIR